MTVPEGATAPVVSVAPAVIPAVMPQVAPAGQVLVSDLPDQALKARIDQAKHSAQTELLASWGVTDPAQVKAYIDAAKAAEEAKKTDATKIAEQGVRLTAYEAALNVAIAQTVAAITPEQKAAVDAIAGDDKAAWLKTYGALAATWGKAAPVAPAPVPTTTPAAPPAPTSTAPVAPAPSPASPTTSPTDHVARYASLKISNPFAASAYLQQHGDACYPKT